MAVDGEGAFDILLGVGKIRGLFYSVGSTFMTHTPSPSPSGLHSTDHAGFVVTGLPAFNDNYIWVVESMGGVSPQQVAVVDPGDAAPVIDDCRRRGLVPQQIWLTHHHADHTGGVAELCEWIARQSPSLPVVVYGPASEAIPGVTQALGGGESLTFGGQQVDVLSVPGHTRGHLAYVVGAATAKPALFCGDLLFGLGCGRLFEGTAAQMHAALTQVRRLPAQTRVYCAHEYTLLNLPFARAVDPQNPKLVARAEVIRQLRDAGAPTVPLTLGEECATNPFLRCDQVALRASAVVDQDAPDVDVFARLRQMRDTFKAH